MPSEAAIPDELEQLRCRFEEFRNTRSGHARLSEVLWVAAAELARRHGVRCKKGTASAYLPCSR